MHTSVRHFENGARSNIAAFLPCGTFLVTLTLLLAALLSEFNSSLVFTAPYLSVATKESIITAELMLARMALFVG